MLLKNTYIYASICSSMTIDTIFRVLIYKWHFSRFKKGKPIGVDCDMNIHCSIRLIYGFSFWLLIFSGRKETSKVWKSVKLLLSLKAWAIKCFRNKLPIEGDMGAITRFCYSYQASSNIYYFSPTFNPHLLYKMAFIWIAYISTCNFKSH